MIARYAKNGIFVNHKNYQNIFKNIIVTFRVRLNFYKTT
jgi:hypothetical protein